MHLQPSAPGTRKRVAIVADAVEFAGAELSMVVLAKALQARWDVVAVVGDAAPFELTRRMQASGVRVEVVPGLSRQPSVDAVVGLRRALVRLAPAVVHLNLTDQGDGLGMLVASRVSRLPTVATLHNVVPGRRRWREQLNLVGLRMPAARIAVSQAVQQYLGVHDLASTVVHNGLEAPEPAVEPRVALGIVGRPFVVGGIGRLHDQKAWDVLCAATPLVRRQLPEVEIDFVVLGGGEESERLRALPGCDGVRFVGYVESASSYLKAFDLLVVPSRYEAFGLVALEGFLAGVPVVASRVGGLTELVQGAGVLVEPEQPAALAEAILELVGDAPRRAALVEAGRLRANRFSPQLMGAGVERVYEEVLAT